jgi:hypothetical protein
VGGEGFDRLTQQEKDALQFLLMELIHADEPMAMLAVLKRIAERMAFRAVKAKDVKAATDWQELVDAIRE